MSDKLLRKQNLDLWMKIFAEEMERGAHIDIFLDDSQNYFSENFSKLEEIDASFLNFLQHIVTCLLNYSPENSNNPSTLETLPEYFVFFTKKYAEISSVIDQLNEREKENAQTILSIIFRLFNITSLTLSSFPEIAGEIGFLITHFFQKNQTKDLLKALIQLNPILNERIPTIFSNLKDEQHAKALFFELYNEDPEYIQQYFTKEELIDLFTIAKSVELFRLVFELLIGNTSNVIEDNTGMTQNYYSFDDYMKNIFCSSLLLLTEKKDNCIAETFIGSLDVENNSSLSETVNEYNKPDEKFKSRLLEAGEQFVATFKNPQSMEKQIRINNIPYELKYFITESGMDEYTSYHHQAFDDSRYMDENIICGIYQKNC